MIGVYPSDPKVSTAAYITRVDALVPAWADVAGMVVPFCTQP
jgi:hypothetical protein